MKESIGYTVTLNIMIIFIMIIFAFLFASLIYFKSNKISNVIINSIEKYEGYNDLAINEINNNMTDLGYNKHFINCDVSINGGICNIVREESKHEGYCVYLCKEENYYYYRVRTNMVMNFPLVNELLSLPIYSNTNRMFDFEYEFDSSDC